jgi:hypothetical protein
VRKLLLAVVGCVTAALYVAPAAFAADFTLHGGAQAGIGDVKLVSDLSDAGTANDASWIDFSVPAALKFSDLSSLSTQFNVTDTIAAEDLRGSRSTSTARTCSSTSARRRASPAVPRTAGSRAATW